jgi:signal transduction histidine kinase/HAMP domain-containing protein
MTPARRPPDQDSNVPNEPQYEDTSLSSDDRRSQIRNPDQPTIKTGLRRKFAGIIISLVFSMALVFFWFFFQEEKRSLSDAFEKRGLALANNLARNVETYLTPPLSPEVGILLKNLLDSKDIVYVSLFDQTNELATVKTDAIAGPLPPLQPDDLSASREIVKTVLVNPLGPVIDFVVPVWTIRLSAAGLPSATQLYRGLGYEEIKRLLTPNLLSLERIGTVRMGLSPSGMQSELRAKSLIVLAFFVFFIVLGLVLVLFLSRVIVDPIQGLARAMKVVASEHNEFDRDGMPVVQHFRRMDDFNLQVQTHDEIEQLSDDFRAMVKKLEDSYARLETIIKDKSRIALEKTQLAEELQKLNLSLEETIRERTREVVEKNLKLYELSEELQFQKEELVNANEQLEKTSRMKSAFLANMSHELRTPLNSIIGFAEILKDKMFGELNERQDKYLSHILTSGRHLLQLINNILDLSKVEAGKMKLVLEPFAVNRVIDEVQTVIKTLAYKKNIEMSLELSPEVVMYGDIAKFKQVLYNLLSNAIKFTPEKGHVTIRTKEVPSGTAFTGGPGSKPFITASAALLLSVSDTGIGIPVEEQEKIFLEFEQTEQTRERGYEGTGLGLALTRKLVQLHGGQIWVKSTPEHGSEFTVVMPVKGQTPEDDREEVKDL